MIKKIAVAIGLSGLALSVFASGIDRIEKSVELKGGATVHIFADGKMAMENEYGRVDSMEEGHAMEAKNGQEIIMKGNETGRLQMVLRPQYLY